MALPNEVLRQLGAVLRSMSRNIALQAVEKEPEAELDPIPDVEWWDARILVDAVYPEGLADGVSASASADGTRGLIRGKVTALVEHPVPIEPPAEPEPPPPRPLMLTAKVCRIGSQVAYQWVKPQNDIEDAGLHSEIVQHALLSQAEPFR